MRPVPGRALRTASDAMGRLVLSLALAFIVGRAPAMAQQVTTPPAPPADAAGGLRFDPPPVPDFMLRKPAAPLTLEEMQKQADDAARRVRTEERPAPGPVAKPQP